MSSLRDAVKLHRPVPKQPNLQSGREVIEKKFGAKLMDRIDDLEQTVFLNNEALVQY